MRRRPQGRRPDLLPHTRRGMYSTSAEQAPVDGPPATPSRHAGRGQAATTGGMTLTDPGEATTEPPAHGPGKTRPGEMTLTYAAVAKPPVHVPPATAARDDPDRSGPLHPVPAGRNGVEKKRRIDARG